MDSLDRATRNGLRISGQHIEAINRPRRIIFQDDVLANDVFRTEKIGTERLGKIIDFYMSRLDEKPNQIDSIWFEWGEGNTAVWPSEVLPRTENVFPKWWQAGIDPVAVLLTEARKRGREVFFSYRINGSDNDDLFDPPHPLDQPIPLKAAHPNWLIRKWHPYWDFSFQGVRDLKLKIVREVAQMYDFDGIQIDFARIPVLFPAGEQWERRDVLTDFMRQVRTALLEVEKKRERPLLLAARVPEDLIGCHFDGMDVETWVRDFLVDILVIGTRTANVDIAAFRRITTGIPIKLYPSWDDHHSSDGYRQPDLEIWRGVCANWWRQNPDGMHTFNLMLPSPQSAQNLDLRPSPRWETQRQVFGEIGSPETLSGVDKVFFVERRGGGHGESVVPSPENWWTPRHMYFQTNMLAPLPTALADDGRADSLFTLNVADDVNVAAETIHQITLHLAISDSTAEALSVSNRLREIGTQIEVRINNLRLGDARTETVDALKVDSFKDWLIFTVPRRYLAVGANLVGVRLNQRPPSVVGPIQIEKLELHVRYR
ncbi:MAG: family 10 glycosylhydrolase [Candidatus Poribacteria bacterium]|nr:family 10 glycosylhydrolase [Candidatus Poribacteria bacterium]